jgi:hypothetical protein
MSNPSKASLLEFYRKATGKPYEEANMELFGPKIGRIGEKPDPGLSLGFDFRDLVKESTINPMGRPSFSQVADFMVKATGCTYESALLDLKMIRPTRLGEARLLEPTSGLPRIKLK